MRAIVIGATGLIGGLLVNKLIEDKAFAHITLVSRKKVDVNHSKIEQLIIDFEDTTAFKDAIQQADVLFCSIGTTQKKVKGSLDAYKKIDYNIPVNAARFCVQQGIKKYVLVSAVGANASSSNFYLQLKGDTEKAIAALPLDSVHFMRPSILLGNRQEARIGESIGKIVMQLISFLFVGSLSKYKPIHASHVADAMIAAIKKNNNGTFTYEYKEMKRLVFELQ